MGNLNTIFLTGRLTREPESRMTAAGIPVTKFSLAVNQFGRNGKKWTDFIECVTWRRLAEVSKEFLKKGELVALEGALRVRSYETSAGEKRKAAEVVVERLDLLGQVGKGGNGVNGRNGHLEERDMAFTEEGIEEEEVEEQEETVGVA